MSTLADELLNDFEDSASEGEAEHRNGFLHDAPSPPKSGVPNGHPRATLKDSTGSMEVDENEEDEDEDEEMVNGDLLGSERLDEAQDEEEAKAKVEKMQLGGVNDVRNVAGLMKTLEPVLEVGFLPYTLFALNEDHDLHLRRTQP
jgi:U4/U6 small nuclear ribonucleoprotein PRP31